MLSCMPPRLAVNAHPDPTPTHSRPHTTKNHTTPPQILRHAVIGMLPKNSLRHQVVKKLRVFPDEFHPYEGPLRGKKSII